MDRQVKPCEHTVSGSQASSHSVHVWRGNTLCSITSHYWTTVLYRLYLTTECWSWSSYNLNPMDSMSSDCMCSSSLLLPVELLWATGRMCFDKSVQQASVCPFVFKECDRFLVWAVETLTRSKSVAWDIDALVELNLSVISVGCAERTLRRI